MYGDDDIIQQLLTGGGTPTPGPLTPPPNAFVSQMGGQMAAQAPGMGVIEKSAGGKRGGRGGSGGLGGSMKDPKGGLLAPRAMNEYGDIGDPTVMSDGTYGGFDGGVATNDPANNPVRFNNPNSNIDNGGGVVGEGFSQHPKGGAELWTREPHNPLDPRQLDNETPINGSRFWDRVGIPVNGDPDAAQQRIQTLLQTLPITNNILQRFGYPPDDPANETLTIGDFANSRLGEQAAEVVTQYGVGPETQQVIEQLFTQWMNEYSDPQNQ